ncbi:DUF58 domain-containing protein [Kiloniella litopenaei]|uniref:DUF58 domain-containing protein n=1 Tax=Kiloniella litopenaei TaxID=1549748 RepID=UPI000695EAED|nr:DUF58 domain-containing protein [Kiloniella litopenaei]
MYKRASSIEASAEKLTATLPPLLVEAERVASTVFQGAHGRRHVGQGDEFWQYRHYSPGDSPRKIDWRRSAKSDPNSENSGIFIRQKEWESAQSLWLWNNNSSGMNWASSKNLVTKTHRASVLSLALAQLLIRGGEKVALAGTGIPPSNSRKNLFTIAQQLESHNSDTKDKHPEHELPQGYRFSQNSALVCFSDFLVPLAEQKQVLASLAHKNLRVWLVQILDPAEMNLPYTGRVKFQQPAGDTELLHSDVESIRDLYIDRIRAHNKDLSRLVKKWGWHHILHTTDKSPESTLLTLYRSISERQNTIALTADENRNDTMARASINGGKSGEEYA